MLETLRHRPVMAVLAVACATVRIVVLRSAGNAKAIAGRDPVAAAGLTQILAQTGQALLGMHIDLSQSRSLTARIDAAYAAGDGSAVARLQARRAKIDDRFDPQKAL